MRRIPFFVLDAFTDAPFAGNPAGVFLDDGASLTPAEMRRIAGEVSLESAFVFPGGADCDLRLRYFTGVAEVPFCGHDTVSALVALARSGRIPSEGALRVATPVGILRAELTASEDGGVTVTLFQNAPEFSPPLDAVAAGEVLDALGCPIGDAERSAGGLPVQVVSIGSPFLFAPVGNRAFVDGNCRDRDGVARLSRRHGALGIYVFTVETEGDEIATWGRCFAPGVGLDEDPVTGSASGALGGYLARHGVLARGAGAARFTARQGFAGGRGGCVRVAVEWDGEKVSRVAITGSARTIAEGTFLL